MNAENLKTLRTLLDDFYFEKDAELARSVAKVTSLPLAGKLYDQGRANLDHIHAARQWVHATYITTPGYKPDVPPF